MKIRKALYLKESKPNPHDKYIAVVGPRGELINAPEVIHGDFYCSNTNLVTLRGCPREVHGNFYCSNTNIVSLKGCPREIRGDFECRNNLLKSLAGVQPIIYGNFDVQDNLLESLKGGPVETFGSYIVNNNSRITSLEFGPRKVGGHFYFQNCGVASIDHAPRYVGGIFYGPQNNITSLKGIEKIVDFIGEDLILNDNPIESHVLGVLLIKGVRHVWMDRVQEVQEIINQHLGSRDLLACQEELIDAGLEEFAQL
jgi:hypothetical protein